MRKGILWNYYTNEIKEYWEGCSKEIKENWEEEFKEAQRKPENYLFTAEDMRDISSPDKYAFVRRFRGEIKRWVDWDSLPQEAKDNVTDLFNDAVNRPEVHGWSKQKLSRMTMGEFATFDKYGIPNDNPPEYKSRLENKSPKLCGFGFFHFKLIMVILFPIVIYYLWVVPYDTTPYHCGDINGIRLMCTNSVLDIYLLMAFGQLIWSSIWFYVPYGWLDYITDKNRDSHAAMAYVQQQQAKAIANEMSSRNLKL